MKKGSVGVLMVFLLLGGLLLFGCSKKEIQTEGLVTKPGEGQISDDEAEKAKKKARIREQELSEQQLREKALAEEEARRKALAAVAAQFENEDVHFEFDQFVLSENAKALLNKKAQWLREHGTAKAQIEGHCDERGSTEYNLALGQKRADAALQYLVALGISPNRLSTISYGKERPVDPGQNEAAWAKNRRAHFVLK
ncbi:MAG: peptidoglycan-associated lipoprotein Pal [Deltaproteobacteria bacterium]|nr:peptidoglycan-associated lipoprotein Pal [Deltaproteobacteria bacterium]